MPAIISCPDTTQTSHKRKSKSAYWRRFAPFTARCTALLNFTTLNSFRPEALVVRINEADRRLCLSWTHGEYEPQRQWWWDFVWHEETARGEKDSEDLLLVGTLTAELAAHQPLMMTAALDRPAEIGETNEPVAYNLKRQRRLLEQANLPKTVHNSLLAVACDQFIVKNKPDGGEIDRFWQVIRGLLISGAGLLCRFPG